MKPAAMAAVMVVAAVAAVALLWLWPLMGGAAVQVSGQVYTIRSMKYSYLPPEGWRMGDPPVIDDRYFKPARLSIRVGDTVVYVNEDEVPHTFTASDVPMGASKFDSGPVNPGGSFRLVFRVPGTYRYFCMLHPHKAGIIEVSP
ncbi:MAG: plastocyanin/azurin family copper-binding protein [Nitrososphaerota archaeon]